MQSPQSMQNILYHDYLSIKRSRSIYIYFSQRRSYNVFLTTFVSQSLSHSVLFTTSFSQRLSHNVFLQRLSHNVFFTMFFTQRFSHTVSLTYLSSNAVFTTSQYTRNLSCCTNIPKYLLCLSLNPRYFNISTLGQRLHTKVPRTKCCINISKYLKIA